MTVFTVGKHNTGQEGSECRAEPHELHQGGDGYHQEQGGGGEEFAQMGAGNKTKQRNDQVTTGKIDDAYRKEKGKCLHPTRELVDKGGMPRICGCMDGQQRQDSENGDHRDILEKKHRKGGLSCRSL